MIAVLKEIFLPTLLSLMLLVVLFVPMEKVFPAKKKQKFFRKNWLLDLCYFLGQYFIWSALVLWLLNHFRVFLESVIPGSFRHFISEQNYFLQVFEVVFLSDILIYWGHRLQHQNAFLWKFHKVHHSSEHLDWLAAHREHPIDTVYTVGLINLPAFVLGFPLPALAGLIAFRGIWAIYIHSNVRLSIGPLKLLIGSPELHHWHHDLNKDAGNYANISPLMDKLFGTYTCPPEEPEAFGIKEDFSQTYAGQMLQPLLPAAVIKKWKQRRLKP